MLGCLGHAFREGAQEGSESAAYLGRRWARLGRSSGRLRGDPLDRRIVNGDPERLLRRMREQRRALAGRGAPQVRLGAWILPLGGVAAGAAHMDGGSVC